MHFASVDFIHMHCTPRSSDRKMNRLGLKEEHTISIKHESSRFNANQCNIVLLYNKPSYQPYIGLNNSTRSSTTKSNLRQCCQPGLENESSAKTIPISRHAFYPPPLSFTGTMIPQRQPPDPLRRKANPVARAKNFELARLLETPEHVHGHPTGLVPLQAIQVQPQY